MTLVELAFTIGVGVLIAITLLVLLFDPCEVWNRIADWRNER